MTKLGDRALLIPRPAGETPNFDAAFSAIEGVVDYVVSEHHIAVYFDGVPSVDANVLSAALRNIGRIAEGRVCHKFRVRYNGADLEEIASRASVSVREVVRLHTAATYEASFLGFMPGFAYLRGLDEKLVQPRRATPRPSVPAGSVAIGGPYTGVYPFECPGGWLLLGELLSPSLFDQDLGPLLNAGDQVRFEQAR